MLWFQNGITVWNVLMVLEWTHLDMWNGFGWLVGWAVNFRWILLQRVYLLLICCNVFFLLLQVGTKLRESFANDLTQFWSDDLALLMLGSGRALTIPGRQLIHSLEIKQRLKTRDVVINQRKVLVVDGTTHLRMKGIEPCQSRDLLRSCHSYLNDRSTTVEELKCCISRFNSTSCHYGESGQSLSNG